MTYLGPARTPARKAADHRLEQALNDLRASKAERTLAREVYNATLKGRWKTAFTAAHRNALKAVRDGRKERSDSQPLTA